MSTFAVHGGNARASGIVTFANFEVLDPGAERFLAEAHDVSPKDYALALEFLGRKTDERRYQNKIQNEGLEVFARIWVGDTTYTGEINYGCLGTGTNAVTATDGQLQTEVFRKLYAARSRSGLSVSLDFYYSKSDTNGTYEEFGLTTQGTASANTGQFCNRVLTGGWTKSSSVGMTVSISLELAAA